VGGEWNCESSGMWRHVGLVTADDSEERVATIFRVERIRKLITLGRMSSSGMLRCVALVRTDVSEERITFINRLTRIGELGTLAATKAR
jgi:hypothetical protein